MIRTVVKRPKKGIPIICPNWTVSRNPLISSLFYTV
nr:MAG TPA: hypothetical protein [Caudoviricetes sp.]